MSGTMAGSSAGMCKALTYFVGPPKVGASVPKRALHGERERPKVMAYPISAAGLSLSLGRW